MVLAVREREPIEVLTAITAEPLQIELPSIPPKIEADAQKAELFLPLRDINVLAQQRKTFERDKLEALADNIALRGSLLYPLLIASLDRAHLEEYLESINLLHKKANYRVEDMRASSLDPDTYLVLIAGERRFRASNILLEKGCSGCLEKGITGGCYSMHMGNELIKAQTFRNISALDAFDTQATENSHEKPPEHERAAYISDLYTLRKQKEPGLTYAELARKTGESAKFVSKAVRYCELPDSIQELVEEGAIQFEIAVALARLKDEVNMTDEDLFIWALRTTLDNTKVKDFQEKVRKHIFNKKNSQDDFFELAIENGSLMDGIYNTLTNAYVESQALIQTTNRAAKLFKEGKLPFLKTTAGKRAFVSFYQGQVASVKDITPFLEGYIGKAQVQENLEELDRAEKALTLYEQQLIAEEQQLEPALI